MNFEISRSLKRSGYAYLLEYEYELERDLVNVQDLEFEAWDDLDILNDLKTFAHQAGDEWVPLLVHDDVVVDGYHRFAAWLHGYYHDTISGPQGDEKIEIIRMKRK